jgi:hypothetical protein
MKTLVVLLMVGLLSGCGMGERLVSYVVGGGFKDCEDGVVYLQFTSGATVAYNTDGSIKTCD